MFADILRKTAKIFPFEIRVKSRNKSNNPETSSGTTPHSEALPDDEDLDDLGDYENIEPPSSRELLEEDLDNLALMMPAINEAWERCERMSDEEIVTTFCQCDPITNQDSKMTLGMNLAHRFIQDHFKIKRHHLRARVPGSRQK
jgi:hypothetical protein